MDDGSGVRIVREVNQRTGEITFCVSKDGEKVVSDI